MFIVTGGGTGIGRALAHALALRQHPVLIAGRRESPLKETASLNKHIRYVCADVSTSNGRAVIAESVSSETIQGLIHNAGIIEPICPLKQLDEANWRQVMATNVEGPLFLTQLLYKNFSHDGRVLHISSGAAYFPVQGWTAYCVSKAALAMLTQCSRLEYDTLAFTGVMPGIIDTDMQQLIRDASDGMASEKQAYFKRLKRQDALLSSETVALFLCWLLLTIDISRYSAQEWDIYDKSHHPEWLILPHKVPELG